jgi:hypothetical protein
MHLGGTNGVINAAPATPKLIAGCWPVAAIALAPPSAGPRRRRTSVFMLVYCMEVKSGDEGLHDDLPDGRVGARLRTT